MTERLYAISGQSRSTSPDALSDIQSTDQADIDISNPAFDFVRSIRVFHIEYSQHEGRQGCDRYDITRLGTYGRQGEYAWRRASVSRVPDNSLLNIPTSCTAYSYRAVFVDWRDHSGTYGFEEVQY